MAGSVVVPDFEITLTDISFPSIASKRSATYVELMLFPTKNTCGAFLLLLSNTLWKLFVSISIAALAPKYDPPIPITTSTSESLLIFSAAFLILSNSALS